MSYGISRTDRGLPEGICGVQTACPVDAAIARAVTRRIISASANVQKRQDIACARLEAYNRYALHETTGISSLERGSWNRRDQNDWVLDLSLMLPLALWLSRISGAEETMV